LIEEKQMKNLIALKFMRGPLATEVPFFAYEGDAGIQLPTAVETVIPPHSGIEIITDIFFVTPLGYFLDLRSRGASAKLGIGFDLSVVDPPYQGALNVYSWNMSDKWILVKKGDVVAQVVISPFATVDLVEITAEEFYSIPPTERGTSRMGGSGRKPRALTPEEHTLWVANGQLPKE